MLNSCRPGPTVERKIWIYYGFLLAGPLVGILSGYVGFTVLRDIENRRVTAAHKDVSELVFDDITNQLSIILKDGEAVASLATIYHDKPIGEWEGMFKSFLQGGLLGDVLSLEWVPIVPHNRRTEYEDLLESKAFMETRDNLLVRASEREEYFPVMFSAPSGTTRVLGFDLASSAEDREAILTARGIITQQSTNLITLVSGRDIGLRLYTPSVLPYPNGTLSNVVSGFSIAEFRLADVVGTVHVIPEHFKLHMFQVDDNLQSTLIYTDARTAPIMQSIENSVWVEIQYVNHKWYLAVERTTVFEDTLRSKASVIFGLSIGLGVTLAWMLSIAAYVWNRIKQADLETTAETTNRIVEAIASLDFEDTHFAVTDSLSANLKEVLTIVSEYIKFLPDVVVQQPANTTTGGGDSLLSENLMKKSVLMVVFVPQTEKTSKINNFITVIHLLCKRLEGKLLNLESCTATICLSSETAVMDACAIWRRLSSEFKDLRGAATYTLCSTAFSGVLNKCFHLVGSGTLAVVTLARYAKIFELSLLVDDAFRIAALSIGEQCIFVDKVYPSTPVFLYDGSRSDDIISVKTKTVSDCFLNCDIVGARAALRDFGTAEATPLLAYHARNLISSRFPGMVLKMSINPHNKGKTVGVQFSKLTYPFSVNLPKCPDDLKLSVSGASSPVGLTPTVEKMVQLTGVQEVQEEWQKNEVEEEEEEEEVEEIEEELESDDDESELLAEHKVDDSADFQMADQPAPVSLDHPSSSISKLPPGFEKKRLGDVRNPLVRPDRRLPPIDP